MEIIKSRKNLFLDALGLYPLNDCVKEEFLHVLNILSADY